MKWILSILLPLFVSCTPTQTPEPAKMINAFRNKDIEFIVNNSSLPFRFQPGSSEDDENVTSKEVLRNKLKLLFNKKYFDHMLLGKQTVSTNEKIIFESKSFNSSGELESESTLTFSFKKSKNGSLELNALILAG